MKNIKTRNYIKISEIFSSESEAANNIIFIIN